MKLKNKKAILPEEVVRIVIAVLCIIVLIFLAVQLYSIFTRSNELEQAKSTLNEIVAKSKGLSEVGKQTDLLVLSPGTKNDWRIVSYPDKNVPSNSQLCICPVAKIDSDQQNECNQKGICQKIQTDILSNCGPGVPNCISLTSKESPDINKVPFKLYIIKWDNNFILSFLPLVSGGSLSGVDGVSYIGKLDSIITLNIIKDLIYYVQNPLRSIINRESIVNDMNSNPELKDQPYGWQINIQTSGGPNKNIDETIYDQSKSSHSSPPCYPSNIANINYYTMFGLSLNDKTLVTLRFYKCA